MADREQLTENEAAGIIKQVLETLDYMHDLKIAHFDLKPENIMERVEFDLDLTIKWPFYILDKSLDHELVVGKDLSYFNLGSEQLIYIEKQIP